MTSSITKRWILNILSVIAVVVVCLIVCLSFILQSYFYGAVNQSISLKCAELDNVFELTDENIGDFATVSKDYVENFDDKEQMEVMVINTSGKVTLTSTGFMPAQNEDMQDYKEAKKSESNTAVAVGKTKSGESISSGSKLIYTDQGTYAGAIRFVVSMHDVNVRIAIYIVLLSVIGLLIIGTVFVSGLFFIRSIVTPLKEMSENAKRIARGDFDATFTKTHNDEIG
ncbi:MAG: HAMP domain-containing protein, partial [Acutalibacteraceae bacterium]